VLDFLTNIISFVYLTRRFYH